MIYLKDFTEHEIEDEIRWMTTETEWIKADTPWEPERTAVGIEICDSSFWNKGYGTEALKEWIKYCFASGEKEIYLETWSGNNRMIKCAEKCGSFGRTL